MACLDGTLHLLPTSSNFVSHPIRSTILTSKDRSRPRRVLAFQVNQLPFCLLYSPNTSTNGAKLLLNKHYERATIESHSASLLYPHIITPHALPMFQDDTDRMTKRKRARERDDPKKTRKSISGPGRGSKVGTGATQHVVQNLVGSLTRVQDPREALLKYPDLTEKDPIFT
ncbi:hypothetical protein FRB95_001866 [Tulasnella sp. JGI-2019a]|nr:hypothetical protein FRB95_001866 [Tulasnella sp. JGI-2019a]